MTSWYDRSVTLADNKSFSAGGTATADVSGIRSPTVLVTPDSIGGTDDTLTIRAKTSLSNGAYRIDQRTVSATDGSDDYTVDVPQCETVEIESANGETHTAEVRENHG